MREFGFELALCAHLERSVPVVARQLGAGVEAPGGRVLDVVCVERGPDFAERVAITPGRIPDRAIAADVGPGRFRRVGEAFDCGPERAASVVERAVEAGFFERERRGGQTYVRQVARYPDWYGTVRGIENKPDLGAPGALETQLRTDVSLALCDEVVLCTGSYVTGAHLNRIPDPVGVWRFDPEGGVEVVREPEPLPVDEPGVELLDRQPGRADVAVVDAADKARARRRLAERAYGKGWRTYDLPACGECEPSSVAGAEGLPHCAWKGRLVDPAAECGPDCPGFEAADAPVVDHRAERAARTPWDPDPDGRRRRQSGLDRFS